MSTTDNPAGGGWDKIQTGIKDTERLIGQKKYNMAMIKARQTLECMVKALCEQSGIMQGNLIDMIDAHSQRNHIRYSEQKADRNQQDHQRALP
jgi:hypothetical protein